MSESLDDFASLEVTIEGKGARAGAAEVTAALRSIEAASIRTAKVMEEQLARNAQDRIAAAARRRASEEDRLSRAAAKAAKDETNAKILAAKQAEQAQIASARKSAQERIRLESEVSRAARQAAKEQISAAKEVESIIKQTSAASAAATKKASQETAMAARKGAQEQKQAFKETEASAHTLRNALVAGISGAATASIIRTIASYEGLKSSLITATKSASGAEAAFKDLQSFADKTPYTLEQATKAYLRMSSAGLRPSIAALRDFGDIASAIPGKDILDFVEAVADGTQGQGRRLKEFGIDLDIQGSKARVKFGEMALVVKNDAASIEDALRKVAQAKFGGSMERQSQTLAGIWSTLQDKAAGLAMEIGEGGLLSSLKYVVVELTNTAGGSKSAARELGEILGTAVRMTGDALIFASQHATEFKLVLAGLALNSAVVGFTSLATGLAGATTALGLTTVAANGTKVALLGLGAITPLGWAVAFAAVLVEIALNWDAITKAVNSAGSAMAATYENLKGDDGSKFSGYSYQDSTNEMFAQIRAEDEAKANGTAPSGGYWSPQGAAKEVEKRIKEKQAFEAGQKWAEKNKAQIQKGFGDFASGIGDSYEKGGLFGIVGEAHSAVSKLGDGKLKDGKSKAPGGDGFGEKKKIDHLAESMSDLRIASMSAADAFSLFAGSPTDAKGLEIQNRLLEWRKKLLDQGVDPAKIEAQSGAALSLIAEAVSAETATQHLKEFTEALSGLKVEASESKAILGLIQSGADARTIAIEREVQSLIKGKTYKAEEIAQLREQIGLKYDVADATDKLTKSEEESQKRQKDLAASMKSLNEELAQKKLILSDYQQFGGDTKELERQLYLSKELAKFGPMGTAQTSEATGLLNQGFDLDQQIKKEEEAIAHRKQLQDDWIDFALDGLDKFGDALTSALDGQEHAWRDFFIQLAISAANLALTQAFSPGGAGAQLGSNLAAEVFHSGGIVGSSGTTRNVSPSVFFGAQRYHRGGYAGLKPDEVPAILQRGERVLSKREMAQGRGVSQRANRNYAITLNLSGVEDTTGFNRALPMLLRRLRLATRGGDDD
jgi:hypothetical protein